MKTRFFALTLGLVLPVSSLLAASQTSPLVTRNQDALLQVLQSNSSRKDKADACRELAVVGDRKAVTVLVPLLADPELSHNARYALETLRGAEVDQALRNQLPKVHGRLLVGVIGSLGVRKDVKAIKPLSDLLADNDPQIAQAAARALGSIGEAAGARAIEAALPKTAAPNRLAFCEGLFRCAEGFAAKGKTKDAIALYDRLAKINDVPEQVLLGALRGGIVTRGTKDLGLLNQSLTSSDGIRFSAAVRAALELGGTEVVRTLVKHLPELGADNQIVVLQALGSLGDSLAVPAIHALAKSGTTVVRVEAIEALAAIGQGPVVPVLAGFLADADREISRAALDGLAGVPGRDADAAAMNLLNSSNPEQRITGITLVGRRRIANAAPALVTAAADADVKVRAAALQRLEKIGTTAEVPELLKLLLRTGTGADLTGLTDALSAICTQAGSPASATDQVVAALSKAQPAQKSALLAVLGAAGGGPALAAVRAALTDTQPEVRKAALQTLAAWPDTTAMPELLRIARAASNETERGTALRGYVRLSRESNASAEDKLKQLSEAATLASNSQEKMLVLAGLGDIPSIDSLKLAAAKLSDDSVAQEACAVTVKIAEKLDGKHGADIGPALNQVLKIADSSQVKESARKRLNQLKLPIE